MPKGFFMPVMPLRFNDALSVEIDNIVEYYNATTKNGALCRALGVHLDIIKQRDGLQEEVRLLRIRLNAISRLYDVKKQAELDLDALFN